MILKIFAALLRDFRGKLHFTLWTYMCPWKLSLIATTNVIYVYRINERSKLYQNETTWLMYNSLTQKKMQNFINKSTRIRIKTSGSCRPLPEQHVDRLAGFPSQSKQVGWWNWLEAQLRSTKSGKKSVLIFSILLENIKFTWTGRKRFWTFVKLSDDIWSLLVMALAVIWRPRCEKEKNNDLKKKTKDIVRHLVGFVVYDSLLLWTTAEWKTGERGWGDGNDQHRCPHCYQ